MSLKKLISTKKTVFSVEDLSKILNINNRDYLRVLLSRMFKRKEIMRIRRGMYAYTDEYNQFELANKLKRPSYVSFERILYDNNIIFQDSSNKITSMSNNSYVEKIDRVSFHYYKIKNDILYDPMGILIEKGARVASIERAICDTIYVSKNYYFDNLGRINKEKLLSMSQIYNKRTKQEVKKICST
ncbi:MAG: hypothetical protein Q8P72_03425 [Candidatus Roizmanbacteria bacterium]|nr:hypothetical protein [Candidatus Roizmanbacteria bacterium]